MSDIRYIVNRFNVNVSFLQIFMMKSLLEEELEEERKKKFQENFQILILKTHFNFAFTQRIYGQAHF